MKKILFFLAVFLSLPAVAQQLTPTSVKIKDWKAMRKLSRNDSLKLIYQEGYIGNYGKADKDYLICYFRENGTQFHCSRISDQQETELAGANLNTYSFKSFSIYRTDDYLCQVGFPRSAKKGILTVKYVRYRKTDLKKIDEITAFSFPLGKGEDYSATTDLSPDSSKMSVLIQIKSTSTNDVKGYYEVMLDRSGKVLWQTKDLFTFDVRYSMLAVPSVLNDGSVVHSFMSQTSQELASATQSLNVLRFDTEGELMRYRYDVPDDYRVADMESQFLKNGNVILAAILCDKDNTDSLTNVHLFVDILNSHSLDGRSRPYMTPISSLWDSQRTPLSHYESLTMSYILPLDNGDVCVVGMPSSYSVDNTVWGAPYRVHDLGGMYAIFVSPDGQVKKSTIVDRYYSKYQTSNYSVYPMNMGYDVFAYGNEVYFIYNESIHKVDDPMSDSHFNANLHSRNCANCIALARVSESEKVTVDNLTGNTSCGQVFHHLLGREGNRFLITTRGEDFGSLAWLTLPLTSKKEIPAAAPSGQSKEVAPPESVAKPAFSPRGRRIKK
jgi:hypothetical protein